MIIDLERFIAEERTAWNELENMLAAMERDPMRKLNLSEIKRFFALYQRASTGLAKVQGLSAEADVRRYLEALVAKAYAETHELRERPHRFYPLRWFLVSFPCTFRRHLNAFVLALALTVLGTAIGGAAVYFDPAAKQVLMPFSHLQGDPAQRVAEEERNLAHEDRMQGKKTRFSAYLMTHNIQVSILAFALGLTWGIGTTLLLFTNGVMLGAVILDYIKAGQSLFLAGWLLPHGVIEIPAILLAGQAGFLLAQAMLGREQGIPLKARLRLAIPDMVTLLGGLALMLVWAGIIEGFFSQYHAPVLPYWFKICFGLLELSALIIFLGWSGRAAGRNKTSS